MSENETSIPTAAQEPSASTPSSSSQRSPRLLSSSLGNLFDKLTFPVAIGTAVLAYINAESYVENWLNGDKVAQNEAMAQTIQADAIEQVAQARKKVSDLVANDENVYYAYKDSWMPFSKPQLVVEGLSSTLIPLSESLGESVSVSLIKSTMGNTSRLSFNKPELIAEPKIENKKLPVAESVPFLLAFCSAAIGFFTSSALFDLASRVFLHRANKVKKYVSAEVAPEPPESSKISTN